MLLGDGRSCAGLERGPIFSNATRVRARLRPQLVSSLGRPILSRSQGASRITRQSCPIGYTSRDGACVGRFLHRWTVFSRPLPTRSQLDSSRCSQTWTSVCSGGPASTSAGTQWAASSVSVPQVTNSYPTAEAAKVQHSFEMTFSSSLNVLYLYLFMLLCSDLQTLTNALSRTSSVDTIRCALTPEVDTSAWTHRVLLHTSVEEVQGKYALNQSD